MEDCIHGFPAGLCDVCYPRTPPPAPRRLVRASPVRTSAVRTSASRSPSPRPQAPPVPPFELAGHRLFHVTHVDNLPAILDDGFLRAGVVPPLDVSSATARELRAAADLVDGRTVAEHVSFYASPLATRWRELRDGAAGAHWSDAARAARATEFVLLGVPGSALGDAVVAVDADAAAPAARFGIGLAQATAVLRRARLADPELADAEVLAPEPVPVGAIAAVSVASEPVRDSVRELFALVDAAPRIAVYPPWFLAS